MRTTLALDDDVLSAVRSLAERQQKTIGEVVSALTRQALRRESHGAVRNGIPLLPMQPCADPVTPEIVNALRDELP
ncbi:MAG: CopG family transcriptional regulator [Burkholderiales bacterium]